MAMTSFIIAAAGQGDATKQHSSTSQHRLQPYRRRNRNNTRWPDVLKSCQDATQHTSAQLCVYCVCYLTCHLTHLARPSQECRLPLEAALQCRQAAARQRRQRPLLRPAVLLLQTPADPSILRRRPAPPAWHRARGRLRVRGGELLLELVVGSVAATQHERPQPCIVLGAVR